MTTPNQSRAETVARIIDPSSWRVLDGYLADVKRLKNAGYDPDNFKHQASLAKAQEIIAILDLPPLNGEPVPMVLFCPKCGVQHIDEPELPYIGDRIIETGDEEAAACIREATWNNPPHRSHLCLSCGHIWRPADIATVGVQAVQTKGKADSPTAVPPLNGGGEEALASLGRGLADDLAVGHWSMGDAIQMIRGLCDRLAALATLNVQGGKPATWHKLDDTGLAELRVNGQRITSFPSYPGAQEAAERINAALSPPVVGESQ